jgi:hypothetical protein
MNFHQFLMTKLSTPYYIFCFRYAFKFTWSNVLFQKIFWDRISVPRGRGREEDDGRGGKRRDLIVTPECPNPANGPTKVINHL